MFELRNELDLKKRASKKYERVQSFENEVKCNAKIKFEKNESSVI